MASTVTAPPIDENEEITRILLSPMHYNNKNKIILPYTFRPPQDTEDISVNRKNYITLSKCKEQGVKMQNMSNIFWGLAIISVKTIRDIGFDVAASPIEDNLAHADIKMGFKPVKGEPLPTEITLKIKELIGQLRILEVPLPEYW